MYLGIEIGSQLLQLGVGPNPDGPGDGSSLVDLRRADVDRDLGAQGIRRQIEQLAPELIARHDVSRIAVAFDGPVNPITGETVTCDLDGFNDFPLAEWANATFGLPTRVVNATDAGGVAEARFGAGAGNRVVFFVEVGNAITGTLLIDGQLHTGAAGIASEIGQLRPGLLADTAEQTVDSLASGWAIAEMTKDRLANPGTQPLSAVGFVNRPHEPESVRQRLIELEEAEEEFAGDLLERCDGNIDELTTRMVAQAATEGNELARQIFHHAATVLGWAIAQAVTLLAPEAVVIGGDVLQLGEKFYIAPLRRETDRYVFPPLLGSYKIAPAALEEAVLHGALALAAAE